MKVRSKDKLFSQFLENISRSALEDYQHIIRKYVKGRHGIYALFRKNRLYYVGLATNLRSRLHHHLKDRHANTWDSFSVYLTVKDHHLRELEALLIRIATPNGNKQLGKLKHADNLYKTFKQDICDEQSKELGRLFCKLQEKKEHPEPTKSKAMSKGRTPALGEYVTKRFHIRMNYKGKRYIAHVRKDGTIAFASESAEANKFEGRIFNSPSLAGKAVAGHAMNGWWCWYYERSPGEWVQLKELRKTR